MTEIFNDHEASSTEAEEMLSDETDIDILLAETPDQPRPAYFIRSAEGSSASFDWSVVGQRALSLLKRRANEP